MHFDNADMSRNLYPRDISNEEWAFVALYLTFMSEDAPPRDHSFCRSYNLKFTTGYSEYTQEFNQ